MIARQTAAAVILPLLFAMVYFGSGWLTRHRAFCNSCYFAWERHIPFVPVMLIPYLTLDFLFVLGLFLCTSHRELNALFKRFLFCLLIAGVCFLLFPVRFGLPRPDVAGLFRLPYQILRAADPWSTLFPSLHAVITLLLWPVFARHTSRPWRPGIHAWFLLTLFSPLLTYQHHIADILAGLALAGLSYLLFPVSRASAEAGAV